MKILVFREKHGDRYFRASTPEEIQESCLKVLRERFEEEEAWCYPPNEVRSVEPMSDEIIATLPEEYRKIENERKRVYEKDCKRFEQEKKWYEAVKLEVNIPVGLAYKLLRWRCGYQYEGFNFEEVG